MISTIVWGTGNVGRAAIRAVHAHPELDLTAVVVRDPQKVGTDAGDLAGLGSSIGLAATDDLDAVLATAPQAAFYAVTGDGRDQEAFADLMRLLGAGCAVVTTSLYPLYDPRNAPEEMLTPLQGVIAESGGRLFVNGVDPGWGNDVLPALLTGVATSIDVVRCQEIFDYSTYDAEDSVRLLVGMGQPMDYEPVMTAPTVPTMIWGGQVRMIARALGVEIEEIRETLDRRPLAETVTTQTMGDFEAGTQGAVRFEVQGIVDGEPRIVVEHITRIHPSAAPGWPQAPNGVGAHLIIIEGQPRIEVTMEATDENGNASAGGNATAVGRLVNALDWLVAAEPGVYDAFDVPLRPASGRLGSTVPAGV